MPAKTGVDEFLTAVGWEGARRVALAGDASFRRYERVVLGDARAVLMDAPPDREDLGSFVTLAGHLTGLGFSAPVLLAEDREKGYLLLEDLGDATFSRLLTNGTAEDGLYGLAVDLLIALHRLPLSRAVPAGLDAYDEGRLLDEAFLLTDWYLPAIRGAPVDAAERGAYEAAWRAVFADLHKQPKTLVLRDYHVDNLLLLDGRDGLAACGLLDFQDALVGPRAYDLVSLLEDARRDVSPAVSQAMIERYVAAFPDLDRQAFMGTYGILGAQRHAKVIGIFTRLCKRDHKPSYLEHIPRLWRLLGQALESPALEPVAAWFAQAIPSDERRIPQCPSPH